MPQGSEKLWIKELHVRSVEVLSEKAQVFPKINFDGTPHLFTRGSLTDINALPLPSAAVEH